MMRRISVFAFLLVGSFFAAAVALADVSIAAFEGHWQGAAVSESTTSVNFAVTSRDIDVEIRAKSDRSFTVTWRTLQRQGGQPGAPDEVKKETIRTFIPSSSRKIWHNSEKGNVYNGDTVSWATLKGQKLTIYSLAMSKKGGYDMLIYSRTLTGLGMKLDFKALRDGDLRRTASGTLIRSGQ